MKIIRSQKELDLYLEKSYRYIKNAYILNCRIDGELLENCILDNCILYECFYEGTLVIKNSSATGYVLFSIPESSVEGNNSVLIESCKFMDVRFSSKSNININSSNFDRISLPYFTEGMKVFISNSKINDIINYSTLNLNTFSIKNCTVDNFVLDATTIEDNRKFKMLLGIKENVDKLILDTSTFIRIDIDNINFDNVVFSSVLFHKCRISNCDFSGIVGKYDFGMLLHITDGNVFNNNFGSAHTINKSDTGIDIIIKD